jgi:DNA helicase HerA-like ATPase
MRLNLGINGEGLTLDQPPYATEGLTACVLGNKGSGKSNTMAVLAEELHANQMPFIYYDPNGDALSLGELGADVLTVGNTEHPDPLRRADYALAAAGNDTAGFVRMVLDEGYSLAVDLSALTEDASLEILSQLLRVHYRLAGRSRQPVGVFVDEAWKFAPQHKCNDLESLTKYALRQISFDGRKRGMMLTVATQRVTYLDKALVFGCNVRLFGKITYYPDYDAIKHYVPATFHQMRAMRSGQVHLVTERAHGIVQIRLRTTTDLGQTPAFARQRRTRPNKADLQFGQVKQLSMLLREDKSND